jgi:hypothetical protein
MDSGVKKKTKKIQEDSLLEPLNPGILESF